MQEISPTFQSLTEMLDWDGFTLRTLSSGTTFALQDVLTKLELRLVKATYSLEYSDMQTTSSNLNLNLIFRINSPRLSSTLQTEEEYYCQKTKTK